MQKFVHRENLARFKKRLAETRDASERQVRLKLLAEDEANEPLRPPRSRS
jgi:hypothetical protein